MHNKHILKNGSIQYQYDKQKFTNLPPRHLLPGEIHNYNNYLLKEKADGILINNLPVDIFPYNQIIYKYQVKAEYIEDLDLYLFYLNYLTIILLNLHLLAFNLKHFNFKIYFV